MSFFNVDFQEFFVLLNDYWKVVDKWSDKILVLMLHWNIYLVVNYRKRSEMLKRHSFSLGMSG